MQTRPYPEKSGLRIWLARSEQRALLKAVDDEPRRRIALQLGLHGLRTDEILQVEPRHFRELANGADGHLLTVPDGKTGKRETPISDDLVDASESPKLSDEEKTSDKKLDTEDAKQLLEFYRDSKKYQGTVEHVVLEIFWHTGCRVGGLRALDLKDYDADERYLYFKNRPKTGTRLKRGKNGQRSVLISAHVCEALNTYIARERFEKRDEHGRKPLISCRQGRPAKGTLRAYCYMATQPCVYQRCPHGEDRRICEFRKRNHSSKCPSSRAPHHVRTGSITWHRDCGVPLEDTAERVNASQDTIKEYYDKADSVQRMDLRRRQYTEDLDVST